MPSACTNCTNAEMILVSTVCRVINLVSSTTYHLCQYLGHQLHSPDSDGPRRLSPHRLHVRWAATQRAQRDDLTGFAALPRLSALALSLGHRRQSWGLLFPTGQESRLPLVSSEH